MSPKSGSASFSCRVHTSWIAFVVVVLLCALTTVVGEDTYGGDRSPARHPTDTISGDLDGLTNHVFSGTQKRYFTSLMIGPSCYGLGKPCHPFFPALTSCVGGCKIGLTVKKCKLLRGRGFRCIQSRH
ncbi:hypothetical protein LSAT2_015683 [Lamellibrachia satsuma]|nr:hypothetical protein LSAT2_015683 [Lamellibrachia satsuma]